MKTLLETISEITKYGLNKNLVEVDKERNLERNIIKLYSLYFEIEFEFDDKDYKEFESPEPETIIENIKSNFPEFGFYKIVLDINDIDNQNENALGDAIDDLLDITKDLMEVKWRIENNSNEDGLWYFKFSFENHIQQHILDLLNYLKNRTE
ncbi:DUF5063 domain-containing protein [Flavobacterium sp. J49]|uniref:DUF5063 domain-containing protein n=1 Tax=Flavobacterium sp. J49 TaxID=2718534 RepID=UPI001592FBCA|nr:DUF5063 domain-containing protein [Flavobacterium sp. J49]MBF6640220.1 DUF5063 domain-containing protein [Flavobacterium sp. J49]NIC01465.1 DUF5063 domain-containing protein [Flavobacterium sp. J49]